MIPAHLQPVVDDCGRGTLDERETLDLFADLLVAGAQDSPNLPAEIRAAIDEAVRAGTISPAGDVLLWPGEGEPPMVYNPTPRLSENDRPTEG